MIRSLVAALLLMAFGAGSALAQAAPPGSDDNHFQFHKAGDGFVRLDLRSGQVSLCSAHAAGWTCQAAPDERAALEAEIARLQNERAGLKKALLDKGLPLPDGGGTGRADLDRMVASVDKAWRRLVEMMWAMQKTMMNKP